MIEGKISKKKEAKRREIEELRRRESLGFGITVFVGLLHLTHYNYNWLGGLRVPSVLATGVQARQVPFCVFVSFL